MDAQQQPPADIDRLVKASLLLGLANPRIRPARPSHSAQRPYHYWAKTTRRRKIAAKSRHDNRQKVRRVAKARKIRRSRHDRRMN